MTTTPDRWHRWLLDVRFGGDPEARQRDLDEFFYPVRDRVLDQARLRPGDTVLDVGTGDGLIAFGALERLGPEGQRRARCGSSTGCSSQAGGSACSSRSTC